MAEAYQDKVARGYAVWKSMRGRCRNPKHDDYKNYGGRGIAVCKEWDCFEIFERDMGPRPAGATIERKDVNKGYEPSNCIWISKSDQTKNTRRTIWTSVDGVSMCLKDACEKLGISYGMVIQRIFTLGWDLVKAMNTPKLCPGPRNKRSKTTHKALGKEGGVA